MLKAGSLTYAIFLSVVSAILCSMMIMLAFMNRNYFMTMDVHEVVRDNAYSGIATGLAMDIQLDYEDWIDLYEDGSDSVHLKKRRWGPYYVISSKAVKNGKSYLKTAVAGHATEVSTNTSLCLTDLNRPLQITGNALIKGRCYLPKKGIDRAYVEGKNYQRDQLIYGQQQNSNSSLLPIDAGLQDYWLDYFHDRYHSQDSVVGFDALDRITTHSFQGATLVATSSKTINLAGHQLSGNIIILSKEQILVASDALLSNITLIAPKIKVSNGAELKAQLVATDTLIMAKNSKLLYPSAVMMLRYNPTSNPYCLIENDALLNGSLIGFYNTQVRTNQLSIEVAPNAEINGLIYSQGNLELNGKVNGTVVCNKFLLATPSGIYENHLLDGEIDRTKLPAEFGTARFENSDNHPIVATWVSE